MLGTTTKHKCEISLINYSTITNLLQSLLCLAWIILQDQSYYHRGDSSTESSLQEIVVE